MNVPEASLDARALHGWQVFTLRPAGEARTLLAALRRHGAQARNVPLMKLRGEPAGPLRAALAAAANAQAWVFASPAAVRHLARVAAAVRPALISSDGPLARLARRGMLYAPGPGTANALNDLGLAPVRTPVARLDSEGLLALPTLDAPLRGTVAVVGAPGGRGLIEATLQERGARVLSVHVYRREPAPLSSAQRDALAQARRPMLIASSAALLARLPETLPAALFDRLRNHAPIVLASARLAGRAEALGFSRRVVARSAQPEHLLEAAIAAAESSPAQRFG